MCLIVYYRIFQKERTPSVRHALPVQASNATRPAMYVWSYRDSPGAATKTLDPDK